MGEQEFTYEQALAKHREEGARKMDDIPDAPEACPSGRHEFQLQDIKIAFQEETGLPYIDIQHRAEGGEVDGCTQFERLWIIAPHVKKDGSQMTKAGRVFMMATTKQRILQFCEGAGLADPESEADYEEIVAALKETAPCYMMTIIKRGEYSNVDRKGIEEFLSDGDGAEPIAAAVVADEPADDPDLKTLLAIVGPDSWGSVGLDATLEQCVEALREGVAEKDEKGKLGWTELTAEEKVLAQKHGVKDPTPKAAPKRKAKTGHKKKR